MCLSALLAWRRDDQAWTVGGNVSKDLWYNCLANDVIYQCTPASDEGLQVRMQTRVRTRVTMDYVVPPRLDPGGAGPDDPGRALLLLLAGGLRLPAVQTGEGRSLLLHRHLPDLGQ